MPPKTSLPDPSTDVIRAFLENTPPFSELDPISREGVAVRCGIEHRPKDQTILKRGQSEVTHLRLLYKGRVKLFLKDEQG